MPSEQRWWWSPHDPDYYRGRCRRIAEACWGCDAGGGHFYANKPEVRFGSVGESSNNLPNTRPSDADRCCQQGTHKLKLSDEGLFLSKSSGLLAIARFSAKQSVDINHESTIFAHIVTNAASLRPLFIGWIAIVLLGGVGTYMHQPSDCKPLKEAIPGAMIPNAYTGAAIMAILCWVPIWFYFRNTYAVLGLNKVLLDKTHLELAAADLDGSSTKDKIVKTLLGVWTAGRYDEAQPTTKWEKTVWKMPCVKLGKHVLELGAEHVKITKTEGILGAYLDKEMLQQTETFIIKTSDIKWIHLSTASRVPLSQWFVTTAAIANPWIQPGAIYEHLDWLLTIIFKGLSFEPGGGCTDIDADVISLFASCDDGSCSYLYNSTTPLLVWPCAIYFFLAFHAWIFASDHRCEIAFVSLYSPSLCGILATQI
eukprot:COSAG06_NODE_2628_length_6556_cov_4.840948_5_plen_424_part_00